MRGLRASAAFLTLVPVGARPADPADMRRAIPWFPVVGALVGLGIAGVYALASLAFPALLAAVIAIGVGTVVTGTIHEDGLADSADALGSWSKDEALRILGDPGHGTYGVVAIALSLLLRVGALSVLGPWAAVAVLPAVHALSRAAALAPLAVLSAAAMAGLGASYSAVATRWRSTAALLSGLGIGVLCLGMWAAPAAVLGGVAASVVGILAVRRIGGVTGDVLGASEQLCEVFVLLMAAALIRSGWHIPSWRQ